VVPPGAPVSADDGLTPWSADRAKLSEFADRVLPADYILLDRRAYLHGNIRLGERAQALAELPRSGRRVIYDDGRFVVWSPVPER